MEDDDNNKSSHQFNDNGDDQFQIVQLLHTNISGKKKQLYWYDIRNFPDSLLIEILAILPVKSIFKCKSVCKDWQTLISHPSFFRFYHSMFNSNGALSRPLRILGKYIWVPNLREFINRLRPEIHSCLEFSVLFLSSREGEDPVRNPDHRYRVLDISDGLILCRWGWPWPEQFVYYICDPFTGQWITLPTREPKFEDDFVEGLVTRFNEDHMLTGYPVVSVEFVESQSDHLNLEMFSSETGKWIGYKLPCTIPIIPDTLGGGPIHCYGALHWPVHYNDEIHGTTHVMLAFDPYKEPKSVRLIPLPYERDFRSEYLNSGVCQLCGESQGTLRYFQVADDDFMAYDDYIFTMWAMKDYEKGEWCCEFKVRRNDLHSSDPELSKWLSDGPSFLPLSFHPLNPNAMYLTCMHPQWVVSCDVLNGRLDVVWKANDPNHSIIWKSAVAFMLPSWPVLDSVTKNQLSLSEKSSAKLIKNLTY